MHLIVCKINYKDHSDYYGQATYRVCELVILYIN